MANIFSVNKPVKHQGRNGFDLTHQKVFDMRPAMLRPVVFQHTVPNTAYRINASDLIRTSPLQRAAFLQSKQDLDFFFVPYSQLYSASNNVIHGNGDKNPLVVSSNISQTSFPLYSLASMIAHAFMPFYFEYYCRRLAAHMGSTEEPLYASLERFFTNHFDDPTKALDYCHKYFWYNNFSYVRQIISLNSISFIGGDVFKLLSTTGYGDYALLAKTFLDSYTGFSDEYSAQEEPFDDFFRFFDDDQLGVFLKTIDTHISVNYSSGLVISSPSQGRFENLYTLCAYQKAFVDYYRNSVVDEDTSLYDYAYSLDLLAVSGITSHSLPIYLSGTTWKINTSRSDNEIPLMTWLRMRYKAYFSDITTGIYKSPQFGSITSSSDATALADELNIDPDQVEVNDNAVSIRFALAMQKYKETLLRAGSRSKDILKAEFGVESRYINDTYVHHIGSFDADLNINKVDATADSGDYSVGDLAANVFSSISGQTIDFTCNDYGIIIGVLSITPKVLYNAYGISPFNHKFTQFEFFHDEFENLGLQPVSSEIVNGFFQAFPQKVLGYSARNNEYKQNIDTVHDSFCTAVRTQDPDLKYSDGYNSNYVVTRPVDQTVSDLVERVYMLPSVMDQLFRSYDNGQLDGSHFQVTLVTAIPSILPMSVMGLPSL